MRNRSGEVTQREQSFRLQQSENPHAHAPIPALRLPNVSKRRLHGTAEENFRQESDRFAMGIRRAIPDQGGGNPPREEFRTRLLSSPPADIFASIRWRAFLQRSVHCGSEARIAHALCGKLVRQ